MTALHKGQRASEVKYIQSRQHAENTWGPYKNDVLFTLYLHKQTGQNPTLNTLVQWQDGVVGEGEVQVLEGAGQEFGR